jgi:hypothetical protein
VCHTVGSFGRVLLSKNWREILIPNFFVSDRFSVEEWIEQNLEPLVTKMEELFDMKDILTQQKHWPRRPL